MGLHGRRRLLAWSLDVCGPLARTWIRVVLDRLRAVGLKVDGSRRLSLQNKDSRVRRSGGIGLCAGVSLLHPDGVENLLLLQWMGRCNRRSRGAWSRTMSALRGRRPLSGHLLGRFVQLHAEVIQLPNPFPQEIHRLPRAATLRAGGRHRGLELRRRLNLPVV
jgi:hypothetical protein